MSWLSKLMPSGIRTQAGTNKNKRSVPEGLWEKCERCGSVLYRPELEENLEVCPKCNFHMAIRARARLVALFDAGNTVEIGAGLGPTDALKFKDQKKYADRIKASQKSTGERDALVVLQGQLKERPLSPPRSISPSWAGRWARWWANASPWAPSAPLRSAPRSYASPPAAAHACRKACSR